VVESVEEPCYAAQVEGSWAPMLEEEECGAEWEWEARKEEDCGELAVQGGSVGVHTKCEPPNVGAGVGTMRGREPAAAAIVGSRGYSAGSGRGEKDSGDGGSSQPWIEQGLAVAAAANDQVPLLPVVKQYCSAQRLKYAYDPAVVSCVDSHRQTSVVREGEGENEEEREEVGVGQEVKRAQHHDERQLRAHAKRIGKDRRRRARKTAGGGGAAAELRMQEQEVAEEARSYMGIGIEEVHSSALDSCRTEGSLYRQQPLRGGGGARSKKARGKSRARGKKAGGATGRARDGGKQQRKPGAKGAKRGLPPGLKPRKKRKGEGGAACADRDLELRGDRHGCHGR
jgi:hypothetical protein